jgi:hypothetical protein
VDVDTPNEEQTHFLPDVKSTKAMTHDEFINFKNGYMTH